jgi:integrase
MKGKKLRLTRRGSWFYATGRISGQPRSFTTGVRDDGTPEATQAAQQRVDEISAEHGLVRAAALPTFAAFWALYQTLPAARYHKGKPKSPKTLLREQSLIRPALVFWGNKPLNTLNGEAYEAHRQERGMTARHRQRVPTPVTRSTVAREVSLLIKVLGVACEQYGLKRVKFALRAYLSPVRERVVTVAEQTELLRRLPRRYHGLVLFLLLTGARISEALGLRPEHIDWDRRMVRLTGKGNKTRKVGMNDELAAVLRGQLAISPTLWRSWPEARLIGALRRACRARPACDGDPGRPAMPAVTPHAFRHTFGWRYLTGSGDHSKRGDIYSLSRLLGHSGVQITQRHYAHLFDEDLRDLMLGVNLGVSAETVQQAIGDPASR